MFVRESCDIFQEINEGFRELSLDDQFLINKEPQPLIFLSEERTTTCVSSAGSVGDLTTDRGLYMHAIRPLCPSLSPALPTIEVRQTPSVGRLPSDILYYMFSFMQTGDPDVWFRTVTTLSHVCAHWRDIATGAPLLWTHVRVSMQCRTDLIFTLDNILHRSQNLNLSLHLVLTDHLDGFGVNGVQILSKHGPRIRTLTLTCSPTISYEGAMRKITSPLHLPHLDFFYVQMSDFNQMRLSVSLARREQHIDRQVERVLRRSLPLRTPYLDWTVRNFQITSLSLKSATVLYRDLFPILVASQATLIHLEYLVSNCHRDWEIRRSRHLTFPKLTSLHIGYGCIKPAYQLVKRLDLPSLQSLVLHDFRRCPDPGLPVLVPVTITPDRTDALRLLREMCAYTTISHITLRGIECFTSTYEEVMVTLQNLLQGLHSLSLLDCDGQFLHILRDITLRSPREDLEGLSELSIISHDYPTVLDILRLRAARELPPLKTLSVNPKMAILRRFVRSFVVELNVREVYEHGVSLDVYTSCLSSRRRRRNST